MWLLNYYRSNTFNKYQHQSLLVTEGGCPDEAHGWLEYRACCPSHLHPSVTLLANRCAWWYWPWHGTRCSWRSTSGQASDLVLPHQTLTDSEFPGTPPSHNVRNPHMQSPFHQAWSVPSGTKKIVFDCWNGFTASPSTQMTSTTTTFTTPWVWYKTTSYEYIASCDGYSTQLDTTVSHITIFFFMESTMALLFVFINYTV